MRIGDGAFVTVKNGRLLMGHVDRPFALWQADPGLLLVLAALARGIGDADIAESLSPLLDANGQDVTAALEHLRRARVLLDEPSAALRDVNIEMGKVLSAAPDLDAYPDFLAAARACEDLTLTSPAAQFALWSAVRHVAAAGIPGALVECGVWRGGSMVLAALALLSHGVDDRDLYLFDTFDWRWDAAGEQDGFVGAAEAGVDASVTVPMATTVSVQEVFERIVATGYPAEHVHCVAGLVQDTVPARAPERVALLRLDTDQYESTRHELSELYPRVSPGGVVIVDDYGKLSGATRATDEYLTGLQHPVLLHRIDTQGRVLTKSSERQVR